MDDAPKNYSPVQRQQTICTECLPPHSRMLVYVFSYLSSHYVNNNFSSDKVLYLQKLWASVYCPNGAGGEYCSEQEGEEMSAVFPTIRNRFFNAPPLLVYFIERHYTVYCWLVLQYGSASLNRPSSGIPRGG
jgi:hypothetical protein